MCQLDHVRSAKIQRMLLRAVCAFVLLGILVAGLWPFHAPRNEVSWLSHANGLFFGKYGSIVSASTFKAKVLQGDGSCSLDIWLEPRRARSSGTILAFYWPGSGVIPFALRQSLGDLLLQRASQNESSQASKRKIYVDDIFGNQKSVLVTISSNQSGTMVFADGVFVRKFEHFKLSSQDLTGRLIVGNSPVTTDDWLGQLKGLAFYDRALTADQVSQHFANWINGKRSDLAKSEGAIALYLFNEGNGDVAHNLVDSGTDLLIPRRFFVLHEQFLERPWDEFRPDRNYWKDIGINIAGFIPLGFFFYAYFSLVRRTDHAPAATIALGFAVSLTVEVLQAFLPTRDSGMTDLMTNTLGTALGAILCVWIAKQQWVTRAGVKIPFLAEEMKRSSLVR
jgi:VanZ like protein/concanavalin A-like lectin/glucanase superfamily protein